MKSFASFYTLLVHTFISLFSIVNPVGMASIFLSLTKDYPSKERHNIAYRVVLYGVILLVIALFFGPSVLRFFGISIPYIQVAGGFLVFFTAWEMLSFKPRINPQEKQEAMHSGDIAFFPLTMPITAGAGALAITIAIASRLDHTVSVNTFSQYTGVIAGIIGVFIFVGICYRFADSIFARLGQTGASVITRLSAFILLAIGVSLIWEGIRELVLSIR